MVGIGSDVSSEIAVVVCISGTDVDKVAEACSGVGSGMSSDSSTDGEESKVGSEVGADAGSGGGSDGCSDAGPVTGSEVGSKKRSEVYVGTALFVKELPNEFFGLESKVISVV